jgi:predicted RND superfamily exporter protein
MVLLAASVYFAYQVKINSNQLDLLPSDLPEVIEARRVTDMIGGTGYVLVTLRPTDRDAGQPGRVGTRKLWSFWLKQT